MSTMKLVANVAVINSTANTLSNSKVVRIFNTGTALGNVAIRTSANVVTFTWIAANTEIVLVKSPTDTLESNNNSTIFGSPIGYSY